MKFYSEEHVWTVREGDFCTLGLSSYAADELGELTFVELPDIGANFNSGDALFVVESVKTASDVICPVGGTVKAVNEALDATPGLVNASPETDGWICRLEDVDDSDFERLMTEEQYDTFLEGMAEE